MRLRSYLLMAFACGGACSSDSASPQGRGSAPVREASIPPLDPENIVSIAVGSPDHTTLVTALKAANYVTSVANPGPLTVFAPTDSAFGKLPAGTVEGLLKPDRETDLTELLKYHVAPAVYEQPALMAMDGKLLAMANGKKVKIAVVDGKLRINDAVVVGSKRASNGVVHVVDGVLLPPAN